MSLDQTLQVCDALPTLYHEAHYSDFYPLALLGSSTLACNLHLFYGWNSDASSRSKCVGFASLLTLDEIVVTHPSARTAGGFRWVRHLPLSNC